MKKTDFCSTRIGRFIALSLLSSVFFFAGSIQAHAANPAFVKLTQRVATANGTTVATPNFSSAVTNGNLIAVWVWYNSSVQSVLKVTDTKNNVYVKAIGPTTGTGGMSGWRQEVWYAKNVTGGTSLAVTATFTASFNTEKSVVAHEYSGLDTVNPVDVTTSAVTSTSNATSPTVATNYANDLIFGAGLFAGSGDAGPGFTQRSSIAANVSEDKLASSIGSYAVTFINSAQVVISQMVAFKAAGAVADTQAPSIPTNLSATPVSSSQINLSWTASTDNISVAGYKIFRDGIQVSTSTVTTFNDIGLSSGTAYTYFVRAFDTANNISSSSVSVIATTTSPDTQAPSIPTNLSATPVSSSQINLSWTASTDNVVVAGYKVFRGGVQIATTTVANFNNSGLSQNTLYSYAVSAFDASNNVSAQSASAATSTLPGPQPDTTAPIVSVTSPAPASTIVGNTVITASTSDPVVAGQLTSGIAGVQFTLDNLILGPEITSAPYSMTWVSSTTVNGNHVLRAVSRDVAGNTTTSAGITVFVNNNSGQSGFQSEILVTGLDFPVSTTFLPDGSYLVAELGGKIKRVLPGSTTAEPVPFLTLTNIGSAGGLQGLFNVMIDPNYATNHYYYVFYTLGSPNVDRFSRFTSTGTTTNLATEFVLYQDTRTAGTDHHGGGMVFGPDGKIYVSIGEHNIDSTDSQNLSNSRGKVLRLNPDGTVPTDNPFYDGAGSHYDAIYAYGLRNPYRMSIDVPTGRIFIGDVGGNTYTTAREEVDLLVRGANYAWPECEGVCGGTYTDPIYDYGHFVPGSNTATRDASITGGFVYRGNQFPASYQGAYFFGDYTQNWLRYLNFNATGTVANMQCFLPTDCSLDQPIGAVVHMTEGPDGALYYTDIGWENESTLTGGKVRRVKYNTGNLAPTAVATATPLLGLAPLSVTFSSVGSSDPENQPLSYSWDFGDGATSTLANPTHVYSASGQYTVRLQVSDGILSSLSSPIVIRVGNPPHATILTPSTGLIFRAGDIINFSGTATDTEDGPLPASAYSWRLLFHHNTHIHPGLALTGTTSGSYTIDTSGHDYEGDTNYEIVLTVTDSDGLQDVESVFIYPDKINLPFDSVPSGLKVSIDGIERVTPFVLDTLINFQHAIGASIQATTTGSYTFSSWSDGGAQIHTITVPSTPQSYTATYNFASSTSFATPTYIQRSEINSVANSSTVLNPAMTVSQGNLMVAWVWYNSGVTNVTSMTDSLGNVFTKAVGPTRGTASMAGWSQELWYAKNITGGSSTVTTTFSGAFSQEKAISVHEYSGLDKFNPLDVTSELAGSTATATTPPATTTQSNDLIFGGILFQGSGGAGTGFTQRSGQNGNATEDKNVTIAGPYSAVFTNTAQSWIDQMAAFRAALQ